MSKTNENITILDESAFMRGKLHGEQSNLEKYANLVLANYSLIKLIKYELIVLLVGSLPGALGLVLRKALYKKLFKKVGRNVVFGRNVTIRHGDRIEIGDNVVVDDNCVLDGRGALDQTFTIGNNVVLNRGCIVQSKWGSMEIGDYTAIGAGSAIVAQGGVRIGRWVGIAGACEVSGGLFEHSEQKDENSPPFTRYTKGPVTIDDNTTLGYGAIVVDGVNIGKNCMVGPGCLVISDMPDESIISSRPGVMVRRKKTEPSE